MPGQLEIFERDSQKVPVSVSLFFIKQKSIKNEKEEIHLFQKQGELIDEQLSFPFTEQGSSNTQRSPNQ
jgi:hypothetical protein